MTVKPSRSYHPTELPDYLKQAIREARMDPAHDHLNELMDGPGQPQPTQWNCLWVSLQELGATLQPIMDSSDVPEWATSLRQALDVAQVSVAEMCADE